MSDFNAGVRAAAAILAQAAKDWGDGAGRAAALEHERFNILALLRPEAEAPAPETLAKLLAEATQDDFPTCRHEGKAKLDAISIQLAARAIADAETIARLREALDEAQRERSDIVALAGKEARKLAYSSASDAYRAAAKSVEALMTEDKSGVKIPPDMIASVAAQIFRETADNLAALTEDRT